MGPKRTLHTSTSAASLRAAPDTAGTQAQAQAQSQAHAPHPRKQPAKAASKPPSEMGAQDARLATFSSPSLPKWPHPHHPRSKKAHIPTPSELAAVGFFYTPSTPHASRKKDDCVTHFLCSTSVSGWHAGENPLERLREANPACPTVLLADSVAGQDAAHEWVQAATEALRSSKATSKPPPARWTDSKLFPLGDEMLAARLETFAATWWPYDPPQARGWKPTSLALAQAGFHAAHSEQGDDLATCAYCGRTLSGWEKGDNPRYVAPTSVESLA